MRRSTLLLALVALACGGGSSPSSSSGGTPQQLNALALAVSSAATTYDAQAAGMGNASACAADEDQYDGQVRPKVGQMQTMGPQMDEMMGSLGDAADADMACAADAMMAELDHHRSMACASATDMGPNVEEAHRHATAMTQWADHEMVRTSAMGSGSRMGGGMGGMTGGGMSTGHCVKNGDGSYSMH